MSFVILHQICLDLSGRKSLKFHFIKYFRLIYRVLPFGDHFVFPLDPLAPEI